MPRCYASRCPTTKSVPTCMDTIRPEWAVVCDGAGCYGLPMLRPGLLCVLALVVACPGPEVTCPTPMMIDRAMDRCVCPEGMEATEDGWSCMSLDAGAMDGGVDDASSDGGHDSAMGQPDAGADSGHDSCDTCVWGCAPECDPPVALSLGSAHSCSLRNSGAVVCWGWNEFSQIAVASSDAVPTPRSIPGVAAAQVASGRDHVCVRTSGGEVACWGGNFSGQLGTEGEDVRPSPLAVPGISDVVDIAAGAAHTCAVTTDRTVSCWGSNDAGQLGVPPLEPARRIPGTISGLTDVVQVVAGAGHSCARTNAGDVYCWGDNSVGQLGDTTLIRRTSPTLVRGVRNAIQVVAAEAHTCAVLGSGELWCWGKNTDGQIDGSLTNRPTPVQSVGTSVTSAAVGADFTCALEVEGNLNCWGRNSRGQLGRGTTDATIAGADIVRGLARPGSVVAGGAHACAIDQTGVFCWGDNELGQIGNGGLGGLLTLPTSVVAP